MGIDPGKDPAEARVVAEERFTLVELCGAGEVSPDFVIELVAEGIIETPGPRPADWHFPGTVLERVRLAARLHEGLDMDLAGVAAVLELLEEIRRLRERLRTLERFGPR